MPKPKHGLPDWGITVGGITTYQLLDVGEMAVRLGSPVSFDRRGEVIDIDSFENGLGNWSTVATGAGASVYLSLTRSRTGLYAVKLTASSDPAQYSMIGKTLTYPIPSNLGFEISLCVDSPIAMFDIILRIYNGTAITRYDIRYDRATQTFYYLNAAAAYVPFATGIYLDAGQAPFVPSKLVLDIINNCYLRFIFGTHHFDLSGLSGYVIPTALQPEIIFNFELWGGTALNPAVYVDDFIFTQNEPD